MIQVQNLVKKFGGKTALAGISFSAQAGDILGFLGPNGAGKTTTMRIITAFIPPTEGTAVVGGFDVTRQPLEARRLIGYLPEQVPLYPDLRVHEYLAFRAEIKGVRGRERRARVDRVVEECRLGEVRREVIGHLSKGYRQRTGLADALVADPPVLILDEPTIGLDPAQIRQTRELIRELGQKRTLVLSTHILPEVEAVCTRVLIVSRGRIAGEGTPGELARRLAGESFVTAEIRGAGVAAEALRAVEAEGDIRVAREGDAPARVTIATRRPPEECEERLFRLCVEKGWTLRALHRAAPSLEEVFVRLVAREPQEEAPKEEPPKA